MDDPKFTYITTHVDKTQRPAAPAQTQRQKQRDNTGTETTWRNRKATTERVSLTPKLYLELAWLCSPYLGKTEQRKEVSSPTSHKGTVLDSLNTFRKWMKIKEMSIIPITIYSGSAHSRM